jgi:hypothetical protein
MTWGGGVGVGVPLVMPTLTVNWWRGGYFVLDAGWTVL